MSNRTGLSQFNRDVVRPGAQRGIRVVAPGGGSGSSTPEAYIVKVDSGQQLFAALSPWPAILGILRDASGTPVTVPAAAPTPGATYANGLSGGYLQLPDGGTPTLVWLAYQTAYGSPNLGGIPKDTNVVCFSKVASTYTGAVGGATTDLYIVGRL